LLEAEDDDSIQVGLNDNLRRTGTTLKLEEQRRLSMGSLDAKDNSDPTPPENEDSENFTIISGAAITAYATSIF